MGTLGSIDDTDIRVMESRDGGGRGFVLSRNVTTAQGDMDPYFAKKGTK
jgi:hypothetical protein